MKTLRPYPEYKSSDVEWLGEIPAHWRALKIKRLTLVKRGASPRPIDDPIYFSETGDYAWVRISDVTASAKYLLQTSERLSELGRSKSVALEPGEIFLSIAATVGKPIITKVKCCIHDGFVYFVGLKENREFLYWLFSNGGLYQGLGKLGTQLNLNTDTIGDIRIPVPPSDEQQAVAEFLDRETARIDGLVAKKERLIALLQEKRTALISHAVTKGLNPNVPMKDSGVEWLGKIPAQWDMRRLKFLLGGIDQGWSPQCDNQPAEEGQWGVLKTGCVNGGLFDERETKSLPDSIEPPLDLEVRCGDVLMSRASGSTELVGSVALVRQRPVARLLLSDKTYRLRLRKGLVEADFFVWVMGSPTMRHQIAGIISGAEGLANNIGQNDIRNLAIPLPPLGDQRAILGHLRDETAKLDALSAKIRIGIERLQEYRTALISAAVTGKIDVRSQTV